MEFGAVSEAFARARRLEGGDRADFLAELDAGTRREVEDLLGHHEAEDAPTLEPAWESLASLAAGSEEPPELSGFRIVGRVGAGGMGVVYEAEQLQPHRRVAIKLLALLTKEGRRRFEREAQVLAELHHPGIAAIHAQGVTEAPTGELPFLVMEFVDGVPLTTFARGLDERARLDLLVKVCDAVAHAHEHGVIHRDLKPANILVTADGRPKVLDFGLARVLSGDSLQTRTGHVLGTLSYMSPEQALGTPQAADTRSDVFALGVIAHEMIGGRLPHDFSGLALPAVVQKLVGEDPQTLPGGGDLAHIIAKAMAREKHRRYATAAGLADDLRRYLNDQSVVARAPTAGEQIGRFVRRNKALVLGLAATVLGLAVGLVFAIRFAQEATLEGARARRMAASASLQAAAAAERGGAYRNLDRHLQAVSPAERGWEWNYLVRHLDRSVATVPIDARLKWMTLSADGSHLLGVGPTSTEARLWDTGDGARIPMELGPRASIGAGIAFAGNDPYFIAIRDRQVWLRHGSTGEMPALMPHSRGRYPSTAAMAPDGSRLAWIQQFGEQFSALHLHDAATGRELWTARGGHDVVAFDSRGEQVAFSNWAGDLIVQRVPSLERRAVFKAQSSQIRAIAFHPDGNRVASASLDHTISIWDLEAKRQLRRLRGHSAAVNALAYSPDGSLLASGGGTLRVWSTRTGECQHVLAGHSDSIDSVRFQGNRRIVSAAGDGIRHWSLDLPEVVRAHKSRSEGNKGPYVYGVAFSPDGTRFASAGWDGTVRLHDTATRRLLATMPTQRQAYCVDFSPDGHWLAAGSRHVEIFDARTGRALRRLNVPTAEQTQRVRFTPDGRSLIATTVHTTALLDAVSGAVQARWKNAGTHQRAAISPDGRTIAHATSRIVHLRAIQPGGRERELKGHTRNVYDLEFSPDGRWLATAGVDRTVRVWDLRTGTERFCLRGHSAIVYAVAFSPDSKRLFSGSDDATVRVWDLERGEERLELRGHDWYVFDLAVHPDGQTVASASGDNTVRLWTTHSDRELHEAAQAMRAREAKWAERVRGFADVDAIAREPGWDDLDRAAAYNLWIEAHGE